MLSRQTQAALIATLVLVGDAASAQDPRARVQCATRVPGPCSQPDSYQVLTGSAADPLVVTNFGVVFPSAGARAQFVCDDTYERSRPDGARRAPDGRLFVPGGGSGIFISADGCAWTRAGGAVADQVVYDIAFDPTTPGRVWAVGGDPSTIYESTDGGASFAARKEFPRQAKLRKLAVAPNDPRTIYAAGLGTRVPLVIAVSTDGGTGWTLLDPAAGFSDPGTPVTFLGVSGQNAQTVLLSVTAVGGDEIWRSMDGGRTATKTLTLDGLEEVYGYAVGADGKAFVAGRLGVESPGNPTARLYVSRDDGATWAPAVPSGKAGPRYACLSYAGGKLYACGSELRGDPFLVGVSSDEGKTWQPYLRMDDLEGVKACVAPVCAATSVWLCESFGVCGEHTPPPPERPADGGAALASEGGGCGCRLGGRPGAAAAIAALALALALVRRGARA